MRSKGGERCLASYSVGSRGSTSQMLLHPSGHSAASLWRGRHCLCVFIKPGGAGGQGGWLVQPRMRSSTSADLNFVFKGLFQKRKQTLEFLFKLRCLRIIFSSLRIYLFRFV